MDGMTINHIVSIDHGSYMHVYIHIPVVPHKALAEVSKIGNRKRRGWLL